MGEEEENSGGGGKKAIEKIAGGGMKKTIIKLVMAYNALTYFLIIFFGIVVIFSVFPSSAPAGENGETASPKGLCVPLKSTDPTSATATNITNYSNNPPSIMHPGAFLDMNTLPASQDYNKVSGNLWGQPELVSLLEGASAEWNKRHPNVKIQINDLSKKTGGPFSPHSSHQVGVDVDIGNNTNPSWIMVNSGYDPNLAIELGKILMDSKSIIYIFYNDDGKKKESKNGIDVQKAVNDYASANNLHGKMQYAKGHENHFHVRIDKAKYKEACGY